ncbi:MAG: Amuc_1100 family pilus-like protein [Kiritimatiellaeota bacterium]|nr:Amuc_1100 family pilus-like protein [Kiritimatiellota bacterium]
MNRQQGMMIGGGVLLGLACVGIGVVFVMALTKSQDTKMKRDTAYQSLAKMYQAQIFPDDANIAQIREDQKTLETWLESATNALAKSKLPVAKVSPSQFKARLNTDVREMIRALNEDSTRVVADFWFGFDKYKGNEMPPGDEAVMSRLSQQMDITQQIVTQLLEAKVIKLDSVTREVFEDGEAGAAQPVQRTSRPSRGTVVAPVASVAAVKSSATNPDLEALFDRQRFGVVFQAHPETLADVLNRLASLEELFIVIVEMDLKKTGDSVVKGKQPPSRGVAVKPAEEAEVKGGQIVTSPESEPPVSVRLSLDVYSFKGE